VFEPFFTTKKAAQSTGLGLAAVHGMVKQHRGWIEATSQVGGGTTFRIFLPAMTPVMAEAPAPKMLPTERAGRAQRILLVEDETPVRELTKLLLQRAGYEVIDAATATDALKLWADRGGQVDLLFADVVMPDGLAGTELAERLRAQKPELKVIYTSGYRPEMVAPESLIPEGTPFLPKPYHPEALRQIVRRCLET